MDTLREIIWRVIVDGICVAVALIGTFPALFVEFLILREIPAVRALEGTYASPLAFVIALFVLLTIPQFIMIWVTARIFQSLKTIHIFEKICLAVFSSILFYMIVRSLALN